MPLRASPAFSPLAVVLHELIQNENEHRLWKEGMLPQNTGCSQCVTVWGFCSSGNSMPRCSQPAWRSWLAHAADSRRCRAS